jgi:hypothetical protein
MSRVERLAAELDLADDEVEGLYQRLDDEGIELRDDCGRARAPVVYANGELAELTADTLGLFLPRDRPLPAAHRRGGRGSGPADRGRRPGGQAADDHVQPAARDLHRQSATGAPTCPSST